jgi:hypothetical protein
MSLHLKRHIRRIAVALAVATISLLGGIGARADGPNTIYLPLLAGGGAPITQPPPPPPPPGGSLPAELAGTWYSGQLLNRQLYNRDTGLWSDPGGLGHMYVFGADGSYVLASYLKLGEGTICVSTVWKYHAGTARVEGEMLLLTPSYARTRTQIACGGNSESETEGPLTTAAIPWQVGQDEQGHTRLQLAEEHGVTLYFKDGLEPRVLGGWRDGELSRAGFYDPASGQWGEPSTTGEWFYFAGDGSYSRGEVRVEYGGACQQAVMIYEEGSLRGSGSDIVLESNGSLQRRIDLCDPSQVSDRTVTADKYERWSWSLRQGDGGPILDLLRIEGGFRQRTLVRDE